MIDPKLWGHIVKAVETVMTEIHLKFAPDGLKVEQMTSDKSAMIGAIIPKTEFIEYNATDEHLIILNMEHVSKIGKRLSKATQVGLGFDEDGPDSSLFQMVLTGEDNRRVFNLPVFAPEEGHRDVMVPFDIDLDAEFQMTGSAFESIIKDLMILAVRGKFLVDRERVVFSGESGQGSEAKIVYDVGKELSSLDKKTEDEPLSASFSLRPLEEMSRAINNKDEALTVKMSNDKPIVIELPLGLDENSHSKIVMILSPILPRRSE
jgi:DNA polymerase III sliding clamp (beta) subunit (PCNA family)